MVIALLIVFVSTIPLGREIVDTLQASEADSSTTPGVQ
jgi:hypothetical protein